MPAAMYQERAVVRCSNYEDWMNLFLRLQLDNDRYVCSDP
jgi:hypothetical protein